MKNLIILISLIVSSDSDYIYTKNGIVTAWN